jgi:Kef-type K+ transport system membrane component KefB
VPPGGLFYSFVRAYAPETPFIESFGWGVLIIATSMGIAGLILKQMGVISSKTAQLILAVAAIDDILALAALTAWQSAAASHGNVNGALVAILMAKNLAFLALAFVAGGGLASHITRFVGRFARDKTLAILLSLTSSSLFGVMAQCWGLSVLMGVYAGGAFLTSVMFVHFGDKEQHSGHKLEELLEPYRAVILPLPAQPPTAG